MAARQSEPPFGIDHLTVVPTNFDAEAHDVDETSAADEDGEA